jgi:hypothetical protein
LCPFSLCSKNTANVFTRRKKSPEPTPLLSRVLWVVAHIRAVLGGGRRITPHTPSTPEEAIAWLNTMVQAINDLRDEMNAGNLPPLTPPAPTPSNSPPAAPPPIQDPSPEDSRCLELELLPPPSLASPEPPSHPPAPEPARATR